jgi:hypothetical protein
MRVRAICSSCIHCGAFHGTGISSIERLRIAEIKIYISLLRFRANCVPATVSDVGTRFIKDWPCGDSISHTGEGNLLTSRFVLNSSPESLMFALIIASVAMILRAIHESIKIAVTMWAKHVEVAKGQEGITNDTFCSRRKGRANELLKMGTRCGRLCAMMRICIVVVCFEVSGHVEGT